MCWKIISNVFVHPLSQGGPVPFFNAVSFLTEISKNTVKKDTILQGRRMYRKMRSRRRRLPDVGLSFAAAQFDLLFGAPRPSVGFVSIYRSYGTRLCSNCYGKWMGFAI